MRTHVQLRNSMMEIIKISLEDPGANQLIVFKDDSDVVLCEVPFKELAALASDAKYEFIALDDTNVLKSVVIAAGTVSKFSIEGDLGFAVEDAITGTVGTLSSQADLKFNKVIWSLGSTVTLSAVRMYIKEGQ